VIALGYIHGGWPRAEFMESVDRVLTTERSPIARVVTASAGPLIAMARNMLVGQFLEGDAEWLMCVDTDIVFNPDAISRLRSVADESLRPVVSGLYYVINNDDQVPAMYAAGSRDGNLYFQAFKEWPEDSLLEVDAVGAGFMLVHRSVFEKIRADHDGDQCWFRECVLNQRPIGEDLSFCIRVAGAGFPVYVHTGVQAGHMKTIMIGKPT
jgi:hypothetical protein